MEPGEGRTDHSGSRFITAFISFGLHAHLFHAQRNGDTKSVVVIQPYAPFRGAGKQSEPAAEEVARCGRVLQPSGEKGPERRRSADFYTPHHNASWDIEASRPAARRRSDAAVRTYQRNRYDQPVSLYIAWFLVCQSKPDGPERKVVVVSLLDFYSIR